MSFVYCSKCEWGQDDFWSLKGYNPLRILFRDYLPSSIRPHWIEFDPPPHSYGRIHSWNFIGKMIARTVRKFFHQHWWTYEAWRKDVELGRGGCPKCGTSLTID